MIPADISEDEYHEWLGRWWAIRMMCIDMGKQAEAMLIKCGALSEEQRRFFNRDEWRELTKPMQ